MNTQELEQLAEKYSKGSNEEQAASAVLFILLASIKGGDVFSFCHYAVQYARAVVREIDYERRVKSG